MAAHKEYSQSPPRGIIAKRGLLAAVALVLFLAASACAPSQAEKRAELSGKHTEYLMAAGSLLKRMEYKPKLAALEDPTNQNEKGKASQKGGLVTDAAGRTPSFRIAALSTNTSEVIIRGREDHIPVYLDFLQQARRPGKRSGASEESRGLFALYSFHLLSPAFSTLYTRHKNPFSAGANPWWAFLLHAGIDSLGTVAIGTKGFSESFQFNGWNLAFLLAHRMITLPGLTMELDLYNRAVKAGFSFQF